MVIREFKNSTDREEVISLWTRVFGYKDKRNDPSFSIDKKLERDDNLFLVAIEDDKVIGTVLGGYDGHRGWIYSLAVDPLKEKQGVGSSLIKGIESALTSLGCFKINLQIVASNESTKEFYIKNGYLVEERISMGKVIEKNLE